MDLYKDLAIDFTHDNLADQIRAKQDDKKNKVTRRTATISARNVSTTNGIRTFTYDIKLGASSIIIPAVPAIYTGAPYNVGDVVEITQDYGGGILILGKTSGPSNSAPLELYTTAGATGVGSTSSTAYVNWPTGTVVTGTFTKNYTASALLIRVGLSAYMTGAVGPAQIAVNVAGTDYFATQLFFNELSSHKAFPTGLLGVPTGLAAGTITYTLRAKVSAGTQVLSCDGNDFVSIEIIENI